MYAYKDGVGDLDVYGYDGVGDWGVYGYKDGRGMF